MKKYVFIICLILCLTGCTTYVDLNIPEQTYEQTQEQMQEQITSEYTTQQNTTEDYTTVENVTEDCTTQENMTEENTTQDDTQLIDNELIEYRDAKITWNLEYPVLKSESGQYNKVNALLVDEIKKLTELPYRDKETERHVYYTGKYEIFEQSDEVISLCYVISMYYEYGKPFDYCYGLTVDIETAERIALSEYVEDINTSLTEIEKGNYTVSYGAFAYESSDKVKSGVEIAVSECELSKSYNNFYIDDGSICFIVNDVIGSDYSVIRMNTK